MSIRVKFEKVENEVFKVLDSEIDTICAARHITGRLINIWDLPSEKAVHQVSAKFPTVPKFLLTGKLTGKLQEAENKYQTRIQKFLDNTKPEELARELFSRLIKKEVLTREEAEEGLRRRFADKLSTKTLDLIFTE